jgi:hypothetical protein
MVEFLAAPGRGPQGGPQCQTYLESRSTTRCPADRRTPHPALRRGASARSAWPWLRSLRSYRRLRSSGSKPDAPVGEHDSYRCRLAIDHRCLCGLQFIAPGFVCAASRRRRARKFRCARDLDCFVGFLDGQSRDHCRLRSSCAQRSIARLDDVGQCGWLPGNCGADRSEAPALRMGASAERRRVNLPNTQGQLLAASGQFCTRLGAYLIRRRNHRNRT